MNYEQIIKHAIRFFQRAKEDRGFEEWNYGINCRQEEYLTENLHHYARKILEKKDLLGEETKAILYEIVGHDALKNEMYKEAKRAFRLAGRRDLVKKSSGIRNEKLETHRISEAIAGDPNHYKSN